MPTLHHDIDREDELTFVSGLPASLATTFDPGRWEDVEWARNAGLHACWQRIGEGATFVDIGDRCWILGMKGAQFLHSDRHMLDVAPEQEGHCWNAVIEADGDQMLLVRETEHGYRHHRLEIGSLIYFNTYQPHLVSRSAPDDACVIVQVGGIGPDRPDLALESMGAALARAARLKRAA